MNSLLLNAGKLILIPLLVLLAGCGRALKPERSVSSNQPPFNSSNEQAAPPAALPSWFLHADEQAVDAASQSVCYLRQLLFLTANIQQAASFGTNEGAMFGTVFCDAAARLHKLPLIRHYLWQYDTRLLPGRKADSAAQVVRQALSGSGPLDYVGTLFKAIGNSRIVMINENHFDWRHRAFTESLLDSFRARGFDLLALETLNHQQDVNSRKFANYYSGFYTRESVFANLVRTAAAKGFTLLAYEDSVNIDTVYTSDSGSYDSREWEQAKNIAAALEKYPGSKLLVHAGYGHISEHKSRIGRNMSMAELLRVKFGYEAVTINQTFLDDLSSGLKPVTDFPPGYYLVSKESLLPLDTALFMQCDHYIFNTIHHYPGEQLTGPDRGLRTIALAAFPLDSLLRASGLQATLEIYRQQELATAFPAPCFIKHISPSADLLPAVLAADDVRIPEQVYLPPGSYTVLLRSEKGDCYFQRPLVVE
ncbi:MAG: hypothetical protein P0Y53_16065 [Candidatus Pseudobacter hemicellulosilyticus]|uniref:Uncharacterized protein n=1 Tax=Candidatus Pseudobacter hemicellulosilyticus TaxID=3121375 RepID=A0AAJ5WQ50_9BACT|nr:MAG: hypothetical protein P0Y53_16065 [Pseudobacter sp.]